MKLLMVQKSGDHQLRLVGSLSHYLQGFSTIPGGLEMGFLKHPTEVTHNFLAPPKANHIGVFGGFSLGTR